MGGNRRYSIFVRQNMKVFLILLLSISIIEVSCNFTKQDNIALVKLDEHQYGWSYILITRGQKPTKIGKYYVFNSDGVCIIDRQSLNDSTKMKVINNLGNDATLRCKQLMRSAEDKNGTIVYKFYCVGSNQTNWSDSVIGTIQINTDSISKYRKKVEYLKSKYFYIY